MGNSVIQRSRRREQDTRPRSRRSGKEKSAHENSRRWCERKLSDPALRKRRRLLEMGNAPDAFWLSSNDRTMRVAGSRSRNNRSGLLLRARARKRDVLDRLYFGHFARTTRRDNGAGIKSAFPEAKD